jgi:ankyrin repeat protein
MQIIKILAGLFLILSFMNSKAGELEYDLFDALDRSDIEYAKELIQKGADVNIKQEPFKQTPIIIAPLRGIDFVKLLINSGANINAKDQDNNTALLNASLYGETAIVKLLVEKGADIYVVNNDGLSVLGAAEISKNNEIIVLIKQLLQIKSLNNVNK